MINCNNIINDKNLNLRKKSDDVSLPLSDEVTVPRTLVLQFSSTHTIDQARHI